MKNVSKGLLKKIMLKKRKFNKIKYGVKRKTKMSKKKGKNGK